MFSPTPSSDEEDAHLPTVAELKRAQAVHARAAKQKKRLPGSSATVDLLTRNSPQSGGRCHQESAQWQDRGKQEAAHKILYEDIVASTRAVAKLAGVDRSWLTRLLNNAACAAMRVEQAAFSNLLHAIRAAKEGGWVEPLSFTWGRMYDETPAHMWTHVISSSGSMEGDSSTAKVMACLISFSMALRVTPSRGPPPTLDTERPIELHIIHGNLSTRLSNLTSLHAEMVHESMRQTMWMTDDHQREVEDLFPRRHIARCSDLHPSNIAAERAESRRLKTWGSSLYRCGMHRSRTAEKHTLDIVADTEAFLLNFTLALARQPGAMKAFRRRVEDWLQEPGSVRIYYGEVPGEVQAWRRPMRQLLL